MAGVSRHRALAAVPPPLSTPPAPPEVEPTTPDEPQGVTAPSPAAEAAAEVMQAVSTSSSALAGMDPDESELEFEGLPQIMWDLPGQIANSAYSDLQKKLIAGMRRDAKHLPTGTMQAMQIERIAYFYTYIRYCEQYGWPNGRDKAGIYKLWRDMTSDFNAATSGSKISPDQLNAIVNTHTAKVVAQVLRSLPSEQARPLYERFASVLSDEEG